MTNNFLVKKVNYQDGEIEINISVAKDQVKTITLYKNSQLVDNVPQEILDQVNNDINSSLF